MAFTTLAAGLSLFLFSAALPVYLYRHRGYSLSTIGILIGLASLVQVAATLAAGPFLDRCGARLGLRVGASCYIVAAMLYLVSGWLPAIAFARILQGIGIALVLPAVFSVVPLLVSRGFHGTALGALGAFNNVGLAVGPPLGLLLLGRSPALLFVTALAAAVVATGLSSLLTVGLATPTPGRLFNYRPAWTPLYAITFLVVVYWGVVTAYLPIEVPSDQVVNVGWFFVADAIAIMVARIPAGFLADRFGSRWLLVGGAVIEAVAIVLLLARASFASLFAAGIGTGLSAALLLPPILLELTRRSDQSDRGTAMALYNTSFAAALGVGSLGAAALVQHLGFGTTLVLSIATCLAAIPVAVGSVRPIEDR